MTAPTLRSVGTVVNSSSSNITLTVPSTAVAGDLLLAFVSIVYDSSSYNIGTLSGWTRQFLFYPASTGGGHAAIAVFSRVAISADPGNTFTFPTFAGYQQGVVIAYQNTLGVDVCTQNSTTAAVTWASPGATASGPNNLVTSWWVATGEPGYAFTVPATTDVNSVPGGFYNNVGISHFAMSGSGGTGTQNASLNNGGGAWSAATIVLYGTRPPLSPTLTAPANAAYFDAAAGVAFSGTYNSNDAAACNAYCLRVKVSGAGSYQYWNASTSALQGTAVWNACSVAPSGTLTVTVPSGVLSDGTVYNWSLAAQEALANLQGPFASDFTFTGATSPTLSVTGPTGSVTTTTNPTATWTTTPASGLAQTAWQVIWESGAYGTTPGSGTSAATDSGTGTAQSDTVPTALTNGVTYRQFVQVTQTGGQASAWGYTTFTISLTPPNAPSLTATAGVDGTTGAPLVDLAIAGHDTGSFSYTNTTFEVEFSDDGTTWADVRFASALTPNTSDDASVNDYEAPLGAARSYRARTIGATGGNFIASAWSTVATATAVGVEWWLTDPIDPSGAVPAHISPASIASLHMRAVGAFVALGRKYPVVVSDSTIGARTGTLNLTTFGAGNWTPANALLDRLTTLLLRSPFGDSMYLWIASASTGSNFGWTDTFTAGQRRDITVPFVEVQRP